MLRSRAIVLSVGLAFCTVASAQEPHHPSARPGPTATLGVGATYAELGGQLAYYLPRGASAVAPYVAVGQMPARDEDPGDPTRWLTGVRGGFLFMFGGDNRWLLDLSYGDIGASAITLHYATVTAIKVAGPVLGIGREWMWSSGVLLRLQAGPYYVTDANYPDDQRLGVDVGLGVGWKPW